MRQLSANAALLPPTSECSVTVRHFLWEDDCGGDCSGSGGGAVVDPSSLLASQLRRLTAEVSPTPALEPERVFDVVLGAGASGQNGPCAALHVPHVLRVSDLLYDWGQRRVLPRVLARRLARPHGRAYLAFPVRDRTLLDAFVAQLTREGLAWRCEPAPSAGCGRDAESGSREPLEGVGEPLPQVDLDVWWPAVG